MDAGVSGPQPCGYSEAVLDVVDDEVDEVVVVDVDADVVDESDVGDEPSEDDDDELFDDLLSVL